MNPLLEPFSAPYGAPPFDKIREEHFIPAINELIREAEDQIRLITSNPEPPAFSNTLVPLEQSGEKLGIISSILFNLNHAETNERLQKVAQEASPILTEFSNRMMMNRELFARIRSIYIDRKGQLDQMGQGAKGPAERTVPEEETVLTNWYRDFVRNGALLEGDKRDRFAQIKTRLAGLTLEFADHVLAETNDFKLHLTDKNDLAGLPDYVLEAAGEAAHEAGLDGWVFTLHAPSFIPFMKYSAVRHLREEMHRAFAFRCNRGNEHDNKERIRDIVNLRLEMAKLLGYTDYASYKLEIKMAENNGRVNDLLEKLHEAARPVALREYEEVANYARDHGADFELQVWDWAYYSEQLKEKKFGFREDMLKPFFELKSVIDGVFGLAERLYGIQFKLVDTVPVYHPDVKVYEVIDQDGTFLSLFFSDFFPRQGKQGGAWMTEFRGQWNIDGQDVRPHISIVCNFSKPTATKPSLLTFDEVNTFLHEFGHALHGIFSGVTYPSVSGTNVYQDFVELPSQIMENWIVEKEWLDLFAVHYKTGEPIPGDLLTRLIDARNFLEGYATERQLGFGFCDMAWHTLSEPFNGDVITFDQSASGKTRIFPVLAGTSTAPAFSHIFAGGYAAGSYGYKWAEVLDADAFSRFKEEGVFNRSVAESFRRNILERGGSEHPMVLYRRFRGQEPTADALLERSGLVLKPDPDSNRPGIVPPDHEFPVAGTDSIAAAGR